MAVVNMVPGRSEVTLTAQARASRLPPELLNVPGGLYPLHSAAFEVDEYRIMAGWPVPVPSMDIRIDVSVSGDGSLLTDRLGPTALVTGADMRWVADADYYDETALQWRPIQGGVTSWETSPEHAPTLVTDYEYRVGAERFTSMTALNFDSDTVDYMWNNLNPVMGGAAGYTVILVFSPNSVYGNNDEVPENGLWAPSALTGTWASFSVRERAIWVTTEVKPAQKGIPIGDQLDNTAPAFLAIVVGRPQTSFYAAQGPNSIRVNSVVTGEVEVPLSADFWLGNSPGAGSHSVDMALLDLGIYGNQLTTSQVTAEFALLSQVYGGDT